MKSFFFMIFVVTAIGLSSNAAAERKPTHSKTEGTKSLKEKALQEIQKIESQPQMNSSQPENENIFLKLDAPKESGLFSDLQYWVSFKLQSFQPEGQVTLPSLGQLNLSKTQKSLMPSLEFGFQKQMDPLSDIPFKMGFSAELGYTSQSSPLTLNSGYTISDPNLRSFLFNTGFFLSWTPKSSPLFEFFASPQLGLVSHHQTTSKEALNFSEQTSFNQLSLGAHYKLTPLTQLTAEYIQKSLNNAKGSSLEVQHRNSQLGVRFLW
ncbi:MAG TPA: hypothetical protein PLJ21_08975 [Pseudobdellovibrionaceae bacterium]|nr:hypothetical protein [Pseudobdellovibrionaceae bacterium]